MYTTSPTEQKLHLSIQKNYLFLVPSSIDQYHDYS